MKHSNLTPREVVHCLVLVMANRPVQEIAETVYESREPSYLEEKTEQIKRRNLGLFWGMLDRVHQDKLVAYALDRYAGEVHKRTDTIKVCPNCGSDEVSLLTTVMVNTGEVDIENTEKGYDCRECGEEFAVPGERDPEPGPAFLRTPAWRDR